MLTAGIVTKCARQMFRRSYEPSISTVKCRTPQLARTTRGRDSNVRLLRANRSLKDFWNRGRPRKMGCDSDRADGAVARSRAGVGAVPALRSSGISGRMIFCGRSSLDAAWFNIWRTVMVMQVYEEGERSRNECRRGLVRSSKFLTFKLNKRRHIEPREDC